jgi:Protein of unknown function (DUF4230)
VALRGRERTDRDTLPLRREGGRDVGDDGGRKKGKRHSPLGTAARVAVIAASVAVILAVVLGAAWFGGLRDSIRNPFATRDIDRSQPAVLNAIDDLNVFKAATGNFRDIVDLEKDAPFLPPGIKGERTLFVAAGTVDAEVDFSKLSGDAIKVSDDRTSVEITLNHPTLARPVIDPKLSYVADRQRGLLDRLESVFEDNPTSERELYARAEQKLAQAAKETELVKHAEDNTRGMLTGMMKSLGFTNVTVNFVDPPPGSGGADN